LDILARGAAVPIRFRGRCKELAGTLSNVGVIGHSGGWISFTYGVLSNQAGGIYDLQADVGMNSIGRIDNAGLFRKSGGAWAIGGWRPRPGGVQQQHRHG
jgi:hypothetical protein